MKLLYSSAVSKLYSTLGLASYFLVAAVKRIATRQIGRSIHDTAHTVALANHLTGVSFRSKALQNKKAGIMKHMVLEPIIPTSERVTPRSLTKMEIIVVVIRITEVRILRILFSSEMDISLPRITSTIVLFLHGNN